MEGVAKSKLRQRMPHWERELHRAYLQAPQLPASQGLIGAVLPIAESARLSVRAMVQVNPLLSGDQRIGSQLVGALEADLMQRLRQASLSMLVLELGVAAERGLLIGDTPTDRHAFFVECLSDRRFPLNLLMRYPVLAKRLIRLVSNWQSATLEMLDRLVRDMAALRREMFSDIDVGSLVNVAALGDLHSGGRRVHRLRFAEGATLIYKPRPVAMESGAFGLIAWLNQHGLEPDLAAAFVVDRNDYGWVADLDSTPCPDTNAVKRFFRRQGANLALTYVLGATDLHFENVLAVGEHPVIVDWETLFQAPPMVVAKSATSAAAAVIQDSAARTLLLPTKIFGDGERHADIGALGYADAQNAPFPTITWLKSDTDEMRSQRTYGVLPPGYCLPLLNGRRMSARAFVDDIEAGFDDAYGFFQRRKRFLLDDGGPLAAFRGRVARHVFRPTAHYARLLTESWDVRFAENPRLLSSYLRGHLLLGVDAGKSRGDLLAAEADALLAGDIPFFVKRVGGRHAYAPSARRRRVRLSGDGWLATRNRIGALNKQDRVRQIWITRVALADPNDQLPANRAKPRRLDEADLIKLASSLGDRLCETAIIRGKGASWLYPSIEPDRRLAPSVTDYDLYNGLSGTALFLGRLARVTGRRRYIDMTHAAMHEALALYKIRPASAAVGCGGDSGLAYAFALLARWLQRDDWRAQARSIVSAAIERSGRATDLMEGRAGLLLGATTVAMMIADDHLLAEARPVAHALRDLDARDLPADKDCGLAHGKAGVGFALARWSQAAGDAKSLPQAKRLLRTDLRAGATARAHKTNDAPAMLAWCRGGLGAAWALLSLGLAPTTARDAVNDLATDERVPGTGALCLCHGLLGAIDFLIDARSAQTPGAARALKRLQAEALGRMLSGEVCADHTHRLENPGLFLGVAGAGYVVLRLADPHATPSAPMFHSPHEPM